VLFVLGIRLPPRTGSLVEVHFYVFWTFLQFNLVTNLATICAKKQTKKIVDIKIEAIIIVLEAKILFSSKSKKKSLKFIAKLTRRSRFLLQVFFLER
jgi:hypothetical protein